MRIGLTAWAAAVSGTSSGPEQESPPPRTAVSLAGKWSDSLADPPALQAGQTGGLRPRDPTVTAAPPGAFAGMDRQSPGAL